MQTIYIVDDDEAMRDSLTWLLEGEDYTVNTYASGSAFLSAHNAQMRGVLVLDVRMPDMTGLELHERLIEANSRLPIIFITGHGDVPMAVAALKNGAWDFIEKPFANEDLVGRIEKALSREKAESAEQNKARGLAEKFAQLTPREQEVMQLVVEGKLNKQIADQLDISMKTVEAHRARVMEKMSANSLPELVRVSVMIDGLHK